MTGGCTQVTRRRNSLKVEVGPGLFWAHLTWKSNGPLTATSSPIAEFLLFPGARCARPGAQQVALLPRPVSTLRTKSSHSCVPGPPRKTSTPAQRGPYTSPALE